MSFNCTKCVVVRITRKSNPINATFKFHKHDIEMVKQGKYLGVILAVLEQARGRDHKKGKQHPCFLVEVYLKMPKGDQGLMLHFSRRTCD